LSRGRALVERWRFGDDPTRVAAALADGDIVALPTESSYGLGVDPRAAAPVGRIFQLKKRRGAEALPVVAARVTQLEPLGVDLAAPILAWARRFWPAALTVVVPLVAPIAASADRPTLAVRIPDHTGLRELLAALGAPLTATSANPSGEAPFVDPDRLEEWLAAAGCRSLIVDGGVLPGGAPSTLVEWRDGGPYVLRQGRFKVA